GTACSLHSSSGVQRSNRFTRQRVRVKMERGAFKLRPNNPVTPDGLTHFYCPPEQVPGEMERLVAMHSEHERLGITPELIATRLHHRFTQIHPFQDGNGRVARALATLVLLKASWTPMVVTRDERETYLRSLESADAGDLGSLVQLFGRLAERGIAQALAAA